MADDKPFTVDIPGAGEVTIDPKDIDLDALKMPGGMKDIPHRDDFTVTWIADDGSVLRYRTMFIEKNYERHGPPPHPDGELMNRKTVSDRVRNLTAAGRNCDAEMAALAEMNRRAGITTEGEQDT